MVTDCRSSMEMPFAIDSDDLSTSLFVIFKYMVFLSLVVVCIIFSRPLAAAVDGKKGRGEPLKSLLLTSHYVQEMFPYGGSQSKA
jgi:hypothetical protein